MILNLRAACFGLLLPGFLLLQGPNRFQYQSPQRILTTSNAMSNRSMEKKLPTGTWGADHVRLEVGADNAEIEFDCAHGKLYGPLTLDDEGRFDLNGAVIREGGPTRIDVKRKSHPARFVGRIVGNQMTLNVTLTDSSQTLGEFTLRLGSEGRLWKCR
jgi:hypothetical protein